MRRNTNEIIEQKGEGRKGEEKKVSRRGEQKEGRKVITGE